MNTIHANDGDIQYVRVSKVVARKAFDAGKQVVLCPVKLSPFGAFRPSMMIHRDYEDDAARGALGDRGYPFDARVKEFEFYNCQMNETGYYASFYVRTV